MPTIRANNIDVAYTDSGAKGTDSPLVLVHGFPYSKGMWDDQVKAVGVDIVRGGKLAGDTLGAVHVRLQACG